MTTVVDHIHLSDTLGGAPENSPDATYSAAKRKRIPEVHISIKRMANGTLRAQRLDSGGVPLVGRIYEYTLNVDQDEIDALEGLYGKKIYLVDHISVADGADHTDYVEEVYFEEMDAPEHLNPGLTKNKVRIKLRVDL